MATSDNLTGEFVFISYSHDDGEYTRRLAAALQEHGFGVWIDERIDYGTEWPLVIQERLDACAALLVVMSPRSLGSHWVQAELAYAIDQGKPIFPLCLEGEPWFPVATLQCVDVRDGNLPGEGFYRRLEQVLLAARIQGFLEREPGKKAQAENPALRRAWLPGLMVLIFAVWMLAQPVIRSWRAPTPTPSPTPTGTPAATPIPASTDTSTPAPTATPTPTPWPTRTRTATPTPRWLSAPGLLVPADGAQYTGWDARVVLSWTAVPGMAPDEYYVVRIPYDASGGVAEFWRQETRLQVPSNFSLPATGFPDRHYDWSVQVKRCTSRCAQVLDDAVRKGSEAVGEESETRRFYWHPDIVPVPMPTPTKKPL
jgi:hypothetical protein